MGRQFLVISKGAVLHDGRQVGKCTPTRRAKVLTISPVAHVY
jgi:hypothetical protein